MLRRGLVGKLSLLLCDSNSEVRSVRIALPQSGLQTILGLTCWVCGSNLMQE